MPDYKRHIAKIANTDQRCIVAMMQIPNRETHALVIPSDALPPRMSQAVQDLLDSPEGQAEEIFANLLSRRLFRDEPNTSVFSSLHNHGYLSAVPVEQVIMFPAPNMPFALVDILRSMGKYDNNAPTVEEMSAKNKFNQHAHNMASMTDEQRLSLARSILVDANLLENDVNIKKEKAYQIAPELRPKHDTTAVFSPENQLDVASVEVDSPTLPISEDSLEDMVNLYKNTI